MMRLIDANLLADYITENEDAFAYAIEHKDRVVLEDAIAIIPTAYDVDKVADHDKQIIEQTIDKCIQTVCLMGFENLAFNDVKVVQALERLKESRTDERRADGIKDFADFISNYFDDPKLYCNPDRLIGMYNEYIEMKRNE